MSEEGQQGMFGAARRDLARLHRLSATVVGHGFGELLLRTSLGRRLHARGQVEAGEGASVQGTPAVRFTRMLASLGPTFIKLGQVLSMRRDLFSVEWVEALQSLQDKAPTVPFDAVRASVEQALNSPLEEAFATFEQTPLATASIAQTHLATTHDGDRVVVKVQREGIEEVMRGDLSLLHMGAQILQASIDEMRMVGATEIVEEFQRALLRELDFREELSNLLRMRAELDPESRVRVPEPYPDLSTKTVLVMQFFEGESVRTLESGGEMARGAVEKLVACFAKQVFVDGFFHGDPHAGNILCDPQGTLCLIDLGLVGELTKEQRESVVTLMVATFAGDTSTIARVLLKMGTPTQRVNLSELKEEIERIRAKYMQGSLHEMDSAGFVQEFAQAAQHFRIKLASEYSILVKSIATLEGIVRDLHPEADIVALARPFVQHTLGERFAPENLLRDLAAEASALGSMAMRMPAGVEQLLQDVEAGTLQVRVVTPELDLLPSVLHYGVSRISLSLFATAMAICCALTLPDAWQPWPRVVLCVALGLSSAASWTILLGWHFLQGRPIRVAPFLKFLRRSR